MRKPISIVFALVVMLLLAIAANAWGFSTGAPVGSSVTGCGPAPGCHGLTTTLTATASI